MVQQRKKWMDKVKIDIKHGVYVRVDGEQFCVERKYQGYGQGWQLRIVQLLPENFVAEMDLVGSDSENHGGKRKHKRRKTRQT
jgi:uncharacterized protein (DUF4415 family)